MDSAQLKKKTDEKEAKKLDYGLHLEDTGLGGKKGGKFVCYKDFFLARR
jgi:hypothetical protein